VTYDLEQARNGEERWILETLSDHEPDALHTQLPVVWDRAEGRHVCAGDGRAWLDWTSGIAVANAGHASASVVDAVVEQARSGLLHAYMFPTKARAAFVAMLTRLVGFPQCVLYTTGAEAVEGALKICRIFGARASGHGSIIVSFEGAFHGRTQGAQYVGGQAGQRSWLPTNDLDYLRLPYPDHAQADVHADLQRELRRRSLTPRDIAAVIVEPWQGATLRRLSEGGARALRSWCTENGVPLVLDEIQSGFGRSGTLFAGEALGITADLLVCSKGLSGSLPVAAVCVRDPVWTTPLRRGELTSTHAANPVALAAATANLRLFEDGSLVANARDRGIELQAELGSWAAEDPTRRCVLGVGMVAGVLFPAAAGAFDLDLPRALVRECADRGLLMCAPATLGGAMVKIMPPLSTTPEELAAGLQTFRSVADRVLDVSRPEALVS